MSNLVLELRQGEVMIVNGAPMYGNPLPWKKTQLTPNLSIDETDDIRPGLGWDGLQHVQDFVKQGGLLIKLELARHGLTLEPEQASALRETEFARAQALWQRKFGEPAPDARGRAKQARFLAARGFASDIVRRVVGGEEEF